MRPGGQTKQCRHTCELVIHKLTEGEKILAQGQDLLEVVRHLEFTKFRGPVFIIGGSASGQVGQVSRRLSRDRRKPLQRPIRTLPRED